LPSNNGLLYPYQLQIGCQQLTSVLEKPRPNPFVLRRYGFLSIPFRISQRASVDAVIFREDGQQVKNFKFGELGAGTYPNILRWDGRDDSGNRVASGVYFLRLVAGDFHETTKFVVIN
jgi:hypothetical protein